MEEFDALKDFIHDGGGVLILAHEGGEEALGTNLNYLIEEYGMSVNADARAGANRAPDVLPPEGSARDGRRVEPRGDAVRRARRRARSAK